jgi:hypothetical protein
MKFLAHSAINLFIRNIAGNPAPWFPLPSARSMLQLQEKAGV